MRISGPQLSRGPSPHPAHLLGISRGLADGPQVLLPRVQLPGTNPVPSGTAPPLCPAALASGHPDAAQTLPCPPRFPVHGAPRVPRCRPAAPASPQPSRAVPFPVTPPVSGSAGQREPGLGPRHGRAQRSAGGRALVGPCSRGAAKALIFLIGPAATSPPRLRLRRSLPAGEVLPSAPGLEETSSCRRLSLACELRSELGTAAAPPRSVIPTSSTPWLPSNRHLVEEEEQEKEEQDGLTQTLPEPPPLPWGQWESGRASHWIHSQAVASPGQAPKQPQCLSQATANAEA